MEADDQVLLAVVAARVLGEEREVQIAARAGVEGRGAVAAHNRVARPRDVRGQAGHRRVRGDRHGRERRGPRQRRAKGAAEESIGRQGHAARRHHRRRVRASGVARRRHRRRVRSSVVARPGVGRRGRIGGRSAPQEEDAGDDEACSGHATVLGAAVVMHPRPRRCPSNKHAARSRLPGACRCAVSAAPHTSVSTATINTCL